MSEERPPWLRRMENGSRGESRARSFLIDRFWILERSVDIDGADLLIQRRITTQNILDPSAPRFGVVQAKFYESESTTHYIPLGYLTDQKVKPRGEFFVLSFTGSEDAKVTAFLMARDVLRNFKEASGDKAGQIALPGKAVFTDKFIVKSQTAALEQIEQSLRYADIISNRQFVLGGLRGTSINPHTDPLYEEPIDNPHASIPEAFMDFKKMANSAMYEVEDFYEHFLKIVSASDPEAALVAYEKVRREGFGVSVKHSIDNNDLEAALRHHKEVHEELTKLRLLKPYVVLQETVREEVVARTSGGLRLDDATTRVLTVRYDPKTLQFESIEMRLDGAGAVKTLSDQDNVVSSMPGKIVVCTSRDFLVESYHRGGETRVADLPPEEHARECAWILVRPFMDEVHRHLTGHRPGMADFD